MKKLIKGVFIGLGLLFTGLGVAGIMLPLLPSTPFFILAVACFAKGSERFHRWFCKTRLYKNYVEPAVSKKEMKKAAKIKTLCTLCLIFGLTIIFVPVWQAKVAVSVVALVHVYFFAFKVKTEPAELREKENTKISQDRSAPCCKRKGELER